jgi:signal transduction histidine kinase
LIVVGYINLELRWREKEKNILLEREEERQAFVNQIFNTTEETRKSIAHELHDDTIHSLLLVASKVEYSLTI